MATSMEMLSVYLQSMKIGQGGGEQWRLGLWMVAVGSAGVGRRRWPAADRGVGCHPKQNKQGKQRREGGGRRRLLDAGELGRRQWRLLAAWLGDGRGPAPVAGGDGRKRKQKRGGFAGLGSRGGRGKKKIGFIFVCLSLFA